MREMRRMYYRLIWSDYRLIQNNFKLYMYELNGICDLCYFKIKSLESDSTYKDCNEASRRISGLPLPFERRDLCIVFPWFTNDDGKLTPTRLMTSMYSMLFIRHHNPDKKQKATIDLV